MLLKPFWKDTDIRLLPYYIAIYYFLRDTGHETRRACARAAFSSLCRGLLQIPKRCAPCPRVPTLAHPAEREPRAPPQPSSGKSTRSGALWPDSPASLASSSSPSLTWVLCTPQVEYEPFLFPSFSTLYISNISVSRGEQKAVTESPDKQQGKERERGPVTFSGCGDAAEGCSVRCRTAVGFQETG